MAIGIYLNGTTGGTDGTLEVSGDGNGVTLGAIGSVGTFHLRASNGFINNETVDIIAPTDCEVSKDNITYGASVQYVIGDIHDTNVICYIKRTAYTNSSIGLITGLITNPRLALISILDVESPIISGTLTATPASTQVTLSGPTATDNVGIAKWQYQVNSGAWVDIASTSGTMPSTVVSGLTNGTAYNFAVRALDAAGNASSTKTASAAPLMSAAVAVSSSIASSLGGYNQRSVARGTDGRLYAYYQQAISSVENIYVANSADGGMTWSAVAVRNDTTYPSVNASIATGNSGKIYCAFTGTTSTSAGAKHLFIAESSDGGATWSGATTPLITDYNYYLASIAVDSSGNLHLCAQVEGQADIYYWKRTGTTWSNRETVYSGAYVSGLYSKTTLAVDSSGVPHVAFLTLNGAQFDLHYRNRTSGAWSSSVVIESDVATAYCNQNIAIDGSGYVHLVYEYGATQVIRYTRSTNGGTSFSTPITVSDEPTYAQRWCQVAVDGSGRVAVLWSGLHAGSTTYAQISARFCSGDPTNISNWGNVLHLTSENATTMTPQLMHSLYPQTSSKSHSMPASGVFFTYMTGASIGSRTIKCQSDAVWQQ